MLLLRFALGQRRVVAAALTSPAERAFSRCFQREMKRLELADEVAQATGRFFCARPGGAMPQRLGLRLAREPERFVQILADTGELLELDGADALLLPGSVQSAADPYQISQSFDGDATVAGCQPFRVKPSFATRVNASS